MNISREEHDRMYAQYIKGLHESEKQLLTTKSNAEAALERETIVLKPHSKFLNDYRRQWPI